MIDYMRTKAEILYTPKAIIPQLVFTLSAKPENHASIQLQLASVRALRVTMEECAPRMPTPDPGSIFSDASQSSPSACDFRTLIDLL